MFQGVAAHRGAQGAAGPAVGAPDQAESAARASAVPQCGAEPKARRSRSDGERYRPVRTASSDDRRAAPGRRSGSINVSTA